MTVTKSFSVEFDDGLLNYEGWKAPRYEGSKLIARQINVFTPQKNLTSFGTGQPKALFFGSNPPTKVAKWFFNQKIPAIGGYNLLTGSNLVQGKHVTFPHSQNADTVGISSFISPSNNNTRFWGGDIMGPKKDKFDFVVGNFCNYVPLGTNIKSAEDEDNRLVRIDGHSYARINRFLVINKYFNTTRVLHIDDIHSASLMSFIGNICNEGDNVNFRVLDKDVKHNIKPRGYFVKSNIGEFAKIYGYEPPRTR